MAYTHRPRPSTPAPRWHWAVAVPLALLMVLTACGQGGDDPDDTPDLGEGGEGDGDELVIGRISALEGAFADSAEDGERGVEMVLEEFDHEVDGRPIRTIVESSDTTPETAVDRARKLVEQDGVDIIHGPLSGGEGVALADYAKDVPHVTFVDAASAGAETTLEDPAENYFRWHSDGAMWAAPMGPYAFEELGYERVATLAEDYAFPHSQIGGFLDGYCEAGGEVAETFWVPLGESDFSSIIAQMPDDIDALYVSLGGSDAVDFLSQTIDFGVDIPIIGGSVLVDETVLGTEGQIADSVAGTIASGTTPPADADITDWQEFISTYQETHPDGLNVPSNFALLYYNSFKSLLLGLEEAGADLDDDGEALREAMHELNWDSPIGPLTLNENRQASSDIFVYEIVEDDGGLTTTLRDTAEGVEQGDQVWERLDACP